VLAPTRFLRLAAQPARVPALCDGRRSIAAIAKGGRIALPLAQELLGDLYREGLVAEVGEAAVPPVLFLEHARALALHQRREAQERRPALAARFARGDYTRRLAVGYLVEALHFIGGAASHIGAAIAHAPDERLRGLLAEYLEEEHWHGSLMEQALRAAGLGDDEIAAAQPLPATLAVMNAWRHAAGTDLLLYGGLVAITESGAADAGTAEATFARTVAQGVLEEAAWRPYFEHAVGDGDADHLALSRALFAGAGRLPRARRDALRRALLLHTEGVLEMEHAIIAYYGPAEGPRVHRLDWRL
jgi:hypothetical protein